MIQITLFSSLSMLVGFEAEGHAEYTKEGPDIVCSAVSALTITALNGLKEVAGVPIGAEVDESGGIYCIIDANTTKTQRRDTDLLLKTMVCGLGCIDKQYPGYLKISQREV